MIAYSALPATHEAEVGESLDAPKFETNMSNMM